MARPEPVQNYAYLDASDPRSLIPSAWGLLEAEPDPVNRHFTYHVLEQALYKSRHSLVDALDEFDLACNAHDGEMAVIRPALLASMRGLLPVLGAYHQQVVRQFKAREYGRVLWWAERGIQLYGSDAARPEEVAYLRRQAAKARKRLADIEREYEARGAPITTPHLGRLVAPEMAVKSRQWVDDNGNPEPEPSGLVPRWSGYYPSIEDASPDQLRFYKWMRSEFDQDRWPDVEGVLAYLFLYLDEVLADFVVSLDYADLKQRFDPLRDHYGQEIGFVRYLDSWQADAAILTNRFDEAWRCQRRQRLSVSYIHNVRTRCERTHLTADDMHKLLLSETGLTQRGLDRVGKVNRAVDRLLAEKHQMAGANLVSDFVQRFGGRQLVDREFAQMAKECDYLLDDVEVRRLFDQVPNAVHEGRMKLFSGIMFAGHLLRPERSNWQPGRASVPFTFLPSSLEAVVLAVCRSVMREAENVVRHEEGLPGIGEGWVGEMELLRLVQRSFPDERIVHHSRPEWLSPQHLDIHLPDRGLGIEYQGIQHSRPVAIFGGQAGFAAQKRRDARKARLCAENGCHLMYVSEDYATDDVTDEIRSILSNENARKP